MIIDLQKKTYPINGKIEIYWFENANIGLKKTLFHRFIIPLKPFDSGINYESQPTETEIIMEWFNFKLENPTELDGIEVTKNADSNEEVSIYLGTVHNACEINFMKISKISDEIYEMKCKLLIDFESEGVAQNEDFTFTTTLKLEKNIQN